MNAKIKPPTLARKFLNWFAGNAQLEDIRGDLDELFFIEATTKGKRKAQFHYWQQVLSLIFSYALKRRKPHAAYAALYHKNSITMLRNYLKLAYRNLKKQKTFTAINIVGLSIGMSIALLALAMYIDLQKFDKQHPDAENIYRVTTEIEKGGDKETYSGAPPALTYQMKDQIPSIYKSVHLDANLSVLIQKGGNTFRSFGYFTEPSFFDLFSFDLIAGSPDVLDDPGKVIITKKLAEKIFNSTDVIGETLETEEFGQLQIGAVLEDFPKHTHLYFDLLTGFETSNRLDASHRSSNWTRFTGNHFYFAFPADNLSDVKQQIVKLGREGNDEFSALGESASYELQALVDITPGDQINEAMGPQFDWPVMVVFFGIALLILLPASFNYANLSIALAMRRTKEVGIRKVMGSHRNSIIMQFIVETIMICMISVCISAFIFFQIRQEFLDMIAGGSAISFALTPELVLTFVAFALLTGLLTGVGPALFFAKISPIEALSSRISSKKISLTGIRKGLLIFQFTLTLIFMMGIGALLKQYYDSKTFDLPFEVGDNYVLYTQGADKELLENYFANESAISEFSFSSSIPGTSLTHKIYAYDEGREDSFRLQELHVDNRFMDHMNLNQNWGEKLSNENHQIEHVIANQEMMDRLKLTGGPDSTIIHLAGGEKARIVGVIRNYNHEPLNESIEPMILKNTTEKLSIAIITMPSSDQGANISVLESHWNKLMPDTPMKVTLHETELHKAYDFFRAGLKIFGFLALLAVSISCLGLLGMVIYSTESRTKEVAIRKILGADLLTIFGSLSGLFIKLWAIAAAIAIPVSYFFYDNFLVRIFNKFGEGLGVLEIAISVIVTLMLGCAAIFWQVNKVARINPARNLRYE